uniref:Uncharacterized protein n=1 Tax=Knipowitschia caucasica TaxID=637954 RepID=A0AAV2LE15_KNICA
MFRELIGVCLYQQWQQDKGRVVRTLHRISSSTQGRSEAASQPQIVRVIPPQELMGRPGGVCLRSTWGDAYRTGRGREDAVKVGLT